MCTALVTGSCVLSTPCSTPLPASSPVLFGCSYQCILQRSAIGSAHVGSHLDSLCVDPQHIVRLFKFALFTTSVTVSIQYLYKCNTHKSSLCSVSRAPALLTYVSFHHLGAHTRPAPAAEVGPGLVSATVVGVAWGRACPLHHLGSAQHSGEGCRQAAGRLKSARISCQSCSF